MVATHYCCEDIPRNAKEAADLGEDSMTEMWDKGRLKDNLLS